MIPKESAARYLRDGRVMQIGTLHDGAPRVNSVYYVASDDMNYVYWMSLPDRRHSIDLGTDGRVAGAIAIKTDHPVVGLQFIGEARELTDDARIESAATKYGDKYDGIGSGFYDRYKAGTNKHHFYEMKILSLELFDEVNFPDGDVIQISLG